MSLLQKVLKQHPIGLVFDIDGTLSPIAPIPDDAKLYPHVKNLLKQASEHAHVAIMTGRTIDNGAAMVNVEGLTYIGTHGLEWSDGLPTKNSVKIDPEAEAYIEPSKILLDLADQNLTHLPGLLVERKLVGGSIHYRLCSNPEEARQTILVLLQEPAKRLNLLLSEGKRVIEIKAPVAMNKGKALRRFTQNFALRAVVFAGDDRTDLDAIMEIASLKKEGVASLSIVVQHTDTLKVLLENADIIVQEVEGMAKLLQVIVENLK